MTKVAIKNITGTRANVKTKQISAAMTMMN